MEAHDVATLIISIVNLVAIIIIPILAVVIGQYLQTKAKKREDKLQIFKLLMTTRIGTCYSELLYERNGTIRSLRRTRYRQRQDKQQKSKHPSEILFALWLLLSVIYNFI